MTIGNVTDIRAVKLEEAGLILAPVLADIYLQYGLELTVLLLQYYSAKGIVLSLDLSTEQKNELINKARSSFDVAIKINVDKLNRMK